MAPRKFELEPWPTLVVVLLLAALLALGRWQLARADEKRALLAGYAAASSAPPVDYDAALPRFAHARVAGRWDPRQFLLDAQFQRGQVGYRILTPLALADGSRLIVDRGWVAAAPDRAVLPDVAIPAQSVALDGVLDDFPQPGVRTGAPAPSAGAWPRVELYPTAATLAAALGSEVQPRLLRLDSAPSFDVAIGFPPERHLGYAVTWFALAATLAALWIAYSLRPRDGAAR